MKIKPIKAALPPLEPGTYPAVCVGIVGIGTQPSEDYGPSDRIKIVWDVPGETAIVDGEVKPRQLSCTVTNSSGKKSNLRKLIRGWIGRDLTEEETQPGPNQFDLDCLLGKPCILSVVPSKDGKYANVEGVMMMPKGFPDPETNTPLMSFDVHDWDDAKFEALPGWLKDLIKKSEEYQKDHASTDTIEVTNAEGPSSGPAGHLPPRGKDLTADPETGEVIEDGGADSSTPLRSAQNDKGKGGVPF